MPVMNAGSELSHDSVKTTLQRSSTMNKFPHRIQAQEKLTESGTGISNSLKCMTSSLSGNI